MGNAKASSFGRRRSRSWARGVRVSAAMSALGVTFAVLVGCSAGAGSSGGANAAEEPAAAGDADRSIVIEGSMEIAVMDADAAGDDVTAIVNGAGGRIDGRDEQLNGARSTTTLVLRIPAKVLDDVIDDLRATGEVESLHTALTDVTVAVRDIDARVAGLESTIARLSSFQGQATSVDDLLTIEKEIGTRQTELEGLRAEQSAYAERTTFSTITLTLDSAPASTRVPDTFWGGFVTGSAALGAFAAGLAVALGVALPWLLVATVLAFAIVVMVRMLRRRRARRRPPVPAVAASAVVTPAATMQPYPAPSVSTGAEEGGGPIHTPPP